ncbi:hypothetical protein [Clostridium baratii]|uniref:hypothetical protein n=1 Tax=Clostridium baratii TaxID=1561 RepID=UPI0006BA94E9|nr:hypothetical protein [Clostridium baratii]MDU1053371.1 hypothetical protein [Clostridium baratii]
MNGDITVLVGMVCTVIGALIGIWKAKKDNDRTIREEAREDSVVAIRLEYISKGVDEIKEDMKGKGNEIKSLSERMIAVEKSASSAHHRIDNLEEKR